MATITNDGLIHVVGEGKCYISADQSGDNTIWAAATTIKKIFVVSNTSGIDQKVVSNSNADDSVYDLNGCKVSSHMYQGIPKGIYIHKGKKIVVTQ